MKAHRKLWESALVEEHSWYSVEVTTSEEFEELDSYGRVHSSEVDNRMYALFAALMFGGDLEV